MDAQKTQIIDRLNQATNILVTVNSNPSVDQLAGAIGVTLLLNKLGKHATAVFSGDVPSTIEFLQPEKTLEKNTDSLRDFIIALDKSKADKLRYKVEDQMVKIFITPYRTSISDKDLEFSQGDFNVEVVLALGVNDQKALDQAITAHGRILHDATVIGVNTGEGVNLGSINWNRPDVSSLCEMLVDLGLTLKPDVLDGQMATAFLTGIVAETGRFGNEKTSSEAMQVSAKLMAAGANQQLVATQLQPLVSGSDSPESAVKEEEAELPKVADADAEKSQPADGSLEIEHEEEKVPDEAAPAEPEDEGEEEKEDDIEQIHIDERGQLKSLEEFKSEEGKPEAPKAPSPDQTPPSSSPSRLVLEPPIMGGKLTANTTPEPLDPSTDPLGRPAQVLKREDGFPASTPPPVFPSLPDLSGPLMPPFNSSGAPLPPLPPAPEPVKEPEPEPEKPSPDTLSDLEKSVDSPHVSQAEPAPEAPPIPTPPAETKDETPVEAPADEPATDVNAARDAVQQAALQSSPQILEPVKSLNAQPMDLNLGDMPAVTTSPASAFDTAPPAPPDPADSMPPAMPLTPPPSDNVPAVAPDPNSPPPVPPPMMPPTSPAP